ncbi:hypothetical protein EGW08_012457 [Elysia chlorotica]|uniref:Apextrin C-terminal domain-containing protein n=1 Tax=Elysia chlorotica TaxID=188477 RepID=A0A3S1C0Q5_ELYCH|nr:hypothetical protein EGW08_012457 [Elysia chlorotica]
MADPKLPLAVFVILVMVAMYGGFATAFLANSKKLDFNLELTVEPNIVTRARTENVKLRCQPGTTQTVQLERFTIMRILKQDPTDDTGETWISIAEKKDVAVKTAVVEYVWPVATLETFGVYHCGAIGFTADASIVSGITPNVEIKMGGVSAADLLEVLMESKAQLNDKVSNNSAAIGELNDQLDDLKDEERNRSDIIDHRLATSKQARESMVHRLLFPENPWPSGQYALPQPDTGCPLDLRFYGGNTGYFTFHGESSQGPNTTFANPDTRLAKPVVTTSGSEAFLTLRFCTSNMLTSYFPWPKGQYCIHSYNGNCPVGFNKGTLAVDTEDTNNQDAMGGNHPSNTPSDLRFCCTKTADYSVAMVLPTERPFYLYRYQGPCQVVEGMNVKLDYFEIAVETKYNSASGQNPYTVLKTNSRRFELCYYSKK